MVINQRIVHVTDINKVGESILDSGLVAKHKSVKQISIFGINGSFVIGHTKQ